MHELGHTLDILEMMIDRLSRELYSNNSMMDAVNSAYESMSQAEKNNYSIKRKQLNNLINYRNSLIETISYNEKTTEGTLPLSFTAKNANLISLVRYGKCVQTNLPLGYTQLEYIESTGTQWIDTGYVPNSNTRWELDNEYTATPPNKNFYNGLYQSSTGYKATRVDIALGTNGLYINYGASNNVNSNVSDFIHVRYLYVMDAKNNQWAYGNITGSFPSYSNMTTVTKPLYLFARNDDSGVDRFTKQRTYSSKIYDDGILVRNFIPAKNSNNAIGMYDLVSGQFFTNAGTGNFIAGPDAVPTPDTPLNIVCNNGVLKARHQSGLPLGYTLLDYIESTGTQYIDTGITDIVNLKAEIVAQQTELNSGFPTLIGAQEATYVYKVIIGYANQYFYSQSGNASGYKNTINKDTNKHTFVVENYTDSQTIYVDNQMYTGSYAITTGTTRPLAIFARTKSDGTGANSFTSMKVWSVKFWRNSELLQDLVPVKRISDNKVGMYDTVNGVFYQNAGTGNFVAGNEVSDPVEIYTDGTPEVLTVSGTNLLDPSTSNIVIGENYNANGTIVSSSNNWISGLIPIVGGKTYAFWGRKSDNTISAYNRINWFNANGESITRASYTKDTVTVATAPSNAAFAGLSCAPYDSSTTITRETFDLFNWMFAEASEEVPYQPYVQPQTASVVNLLSVGDYKDIQDIISGAVTRNVGVKVLDGTEYWQLATATNLVQFYTSDTQDVIANKVSLVSTIAPYGCVIANRTQYDFGCYSGNSGNLCFQMKGSATLTSVSAWTQYLANQYAAGTPVIVLYPLATPTTESVDGQYLYTTDGVNTVSSTSSLESVTAKITYYE